MDESRYCISENGDTLFRLDKLGPAERNYAEVTTITAHGESRIPLKRISDYQDFLEGFGMNRALNAQEYQAERLRLQRVKHPERRG